MAIIDGEFTLVNAISMVEQVADVPTPDTGKWKVFFKSGGLYIIDDAGAVTGPLVDDPPYPQFARLFIRDFRVVTGCGGSISFAPATAKIFNLEGNQTTPGNGDKIQASVFLEAGTYNFSAIGEKSASRGIIDWALDDVTFKTGDDWYNGSSVNNFISTGSVVIANSGRHILSLTINGKNASSSNYYFSITCVEFSNTTLTVGV